MSNYELPPEPTREIAGEAAEASEEKESPEDFDLYRTSPESGFWAGESVSDLVERVDRAEMLFDEAADRLRAEVTEVFQEAVKSPPQWLDIEEENVDQLLESGQSARGNEKLATLVVRGGREWDEKLATLVIANQVALERGTLLEENPAVAMTKKVIEDSYVLHAAREEIAAETTSFMGPRESDVVRRALEMKQLLRQEGNEISDETALSLISGLTQKAFGPFEEELRQREESEGRKVEEEKEKAAAARKQRALDTLGELRGLMIEKFAREQELFGRMSRPKETKG